jgi:RHS repeat-associated protein
VIQIANGKDSNRTQNFLYDSLNRIWQAYTSGPNWGETYSPTTYAAGTPFSASNAGIDAWGNLTNRSPVTGKTLYEPLSCSANTQNRLISCFTYDVPGNLIKNGSATYTYDAENRLIATAGTSYVYDGDGNRIEKCTAGTTPGTCASSATGTFYWLHAGGGTLAESDLGGNWTAVYGLIHGMIADRVDLPSNTVHYYFHDHLGSTSIVTDASGTIENESDYYPYGGEIVITASDSNRYKFTGKERDTESGFDEFGARYYTSSLGRFMTPDWAAKPTTVPYAKFGDPQTLNLYTYVENAPLNRIDADGHVAWWAGDQNQACEGSWGCAAETANDSQTKPDTAKNQKTDDPKNLQLVPVTDSGSDHQPYRVIQYQLETKSGDTPNQNWYVTEQQTNKTLAPNGTSTGDKPNSFKDSVGGNGPADSKQTFYISTTKGKEEFQTFVHTKAGDYGEIAIHIEHSGNQPAKQTEGITTNGYFSWPGATVVHYDWPGPHP